MPADAPRLAVLIDADNTSPKLAKDLFDEIAKIGEASVRRIYGDFSDDRMKGWTKILPGLAIIPHQQFAYTVGKNSSDIALVIDAMDLLHTHRFDGFVLVSSDSDFTRLASRIREEGVDVYGVGRRNTPEAFRQACKRFIFTENLGAAPDEAAAPSAASSKTATAEPAATDRAQPEPPSKAIPALRKALDSIADEDGWASLGALGQRVAAMEPDFDSRTYGAAKLSGLVKQTGYFTLETRDGHLAVREKKKKGGS